jgi:two-component system cell cycle response regulator
MRVLIAEDDSASRRCLESSLAELGYEVVLTKDGREAWEILNRDDAPRLAILGLMLPEMDGIQICRALRESSGEPYIYIILVTARAKKEDLIGAIRAGADAFLTEPIDPQELQLQLHAGSRIVELQQALIAARETLRAQASYDSLTGLWNRRVILDILDREVARSRREGKSLGVLLVDLDNFKEVNDTYGHMVGDVVLRGAAKRMLSLVRVYDSVGRYGGEEFLIVLPGCNVQAVLGVAERLRAGMAHSDIRTAVGAIRLTISLGAVVINHTEEAHANSFLQAADEALYLAKARGRNRVEVALRTSR